MRPSPLLFLCAAALTALGLVAAPLAASAAEPGDGQYVLTLEKGVENGQPVTLYLCVHGGACKQGWGLPITYWPIGIYAPELKLDGARLSGPVRAVFHSGSVPYVGIPPGRLTSPSTNDPVTLWKGVIYNYVLDAKVNGHAVTGTFTGKYAGKAGPVEVSGKLTGELRPWAEVEKEYAIAPGRDFPCWRGAFGNGTCADSGVPMVESWADARFAWRSEALIEAGYYNAHGMLSLQQGYSAPVVAGNCLYVYYFDGSGEATTPGYVQNAMKERPAVPEAAWKRKFATKADDVILCVDARTGQTLWKAVFKEKGENLSGRGRVSAGISSKAGCQLTVCAAYGKVLARGTAGGVYCVDAQTGKTLWETSAPGGETISVTYTGGVFIVPSNAGLLGLDPENGRKLWVTRVELGGRNATPVRWTHAGQEYLIAGLNCLEPKTGKVLWTIASATPGATSPAVTEDYMLIGSMGKAGKFTACYKIDPAKGATKVWERKDVGLCDQAPVLYKDHAYWPGDGFLCVELATGKTVGKIASYPTLERCPLSSVVGGDGRVFQEGCLFKADPQDFRCLGIPSGASYASSDTACYADGRLFWRTWNGIVCFDLRKAGGR